MAKARIRCPKCNKQIPRSAPTCPFCGAETRDRSQPTAPAAAPEVQARRALLIKVLIIGLACAIIFGLLSYGTETRSSGWLYSAVALVGLNSPGALLITKVIFWAALAVAIVCFAMLQQMEES